MDCASFTLTTDVPGGLQECPPFQLKVHVGPVEQEVSSWVLHLCLSDFNFTLADAWVATRIVDPQRTPLESLSTRPTPPTLQKSHIHTGINLFLQIPYTNSSHKRAKTSSKQFHTHTTATRTRHNAPTTIKTPEYSLAKVFRSFKFGCEWIKTTTPKFT